MKYFSLASLKNYFLLAACSVFFTFSSCVKKQNYPDVPAITFNSFTPFYDATSPNVLDSAYFEVNFTDGNGDIGYPSQQVGAPVNFVIEPLVFHLRTKQYMLYIGPGGDTTKFPYVIPDITPSGSNKELNGIIRANFEKLYQNEVTGITNLDSNDPYNFECKVWLYDRAGNKSNVLLTPVLHIRPE